jgi:hypothetical protein
MTDDIGNPPYSSLIMDGFFDDVSRVFGVPVSAMQDISASEMPTMRCGKLCSQDDTGMWHIWPHQVVR